MDATVFFFWNIKRGVLPVKDKNSLSLKCLKKNILPEVVPPSNVTSSSLRDLHPEDREDSLKDAAAIAQDGRNRIPVDTFTGYIYISTYNEMNSSAGIIKEE